MRIAYLLTWDLSNENGVTKKVFLQTQNWQNEGHTVQIFCISIDKNLDLSTDNSVPIMFFKRPGLLNHFLSYNIFIDDIYKSMTAFNPDIIYNRLEIYKFGFNRLYHLAPVIGELNTNDLAIVRTKAMKSLKGFMRFVYSTLVFHRTFQELSGLITVTDELKNIYLKKFPLLKTCVIPNAIDIGNYELYYPKTPTNDKVKFVFIISTGWFAQGLDILLKMATLTQDIFVFNVIGVGKPSNTKVPPNVIFHGYLTRDLYEPIVINSDIGIGGLGLYRTGLHEASTLKVREYLAYGLPVIVGHSDSAFKNNKPEWILEIPNTENGAIEAIEPIKKFALKMCNTRLQNCEVSAYIDSSTYEKKRLGFFQNILSTYSSSNC